MIGQSFGRRKMGMEIASFGSMTCRSEDIERGMEPDECYWIANEPALNEEHDDFKWLTPGTFAELKLTGGLPEVIEAARRLIRA